jgi:hypothetical protein
MGHTSGPTFPDHGPGPYGGVSHKEYSDLVKEQLDEYIKANGISEKNKMTPEQMQEFSDRMKEGKLHNGQKPPKGSKFNKIKQFNDSIQKQRGAFEARSRGRAKPWKCSIEDNKARGKWYREQSGRFGSALLLCLLFEMASDSAQLAQVASNSGHFRTAIQHLMNGNLAGATRSMIGGPDEGGFGGFAGELVDAGLAKPAAWFSQWWSDRVDDIVRRGRRFER